VFDAWLNGTLIPQAIKLVDNFVGLRDGTLRHFNPHNDQTITLDGNGKNVLFIPPRYSPILGLGTVNVNDTAVGDVTNIKVYKQFVRYYGGHFSEGMQNIDLIGSYGYATVPDDVAFICAELCSNVLLDMQRRFSAEDVAHTSPGQTDIASMYASGAIFHAPHIFTKDMKMRLREYKIEWIDLG
jgi:hypothetical protein